MKDRILSATLGAVVGIAGFAAVTSHQTWYAERGSYHVLVAGPFNSAEACERGMQLPATDPAPKATADGDWVPVGPTRRNGICVKH